MNSDRVATETRRHRVNFLSCLAVSVAFLVFVPARSVSVLDRPLSPCAPSLGRISFPTSGSAAGAAALHPRRAASSQLRVRRCDRGVPAGAAGRSGLRDGVLGRGAVLQPAALVQRKSSTRRARARAPAPTRGRGRRRRRPHARRPISTRSSGFRRRRQAGARPRLRRSHGPARTRQFPEDDEAAALLRARAARDYSAEQRNLAVSLKAGEIALAILKKNPQHPGAAHYALHAFDDGEHARWGCRRRGPTRASRRRRATRATCRRTCFCRSACGTRRSPPTNRRSPRRWSWRSGRACPRRRTTSTRCRGCITNIFSRGASVRREK